MAATSQPASGHICAYRIHNEYVVVWSYSPRVRAKQRERERVKERTREYILNNGRRTLFVVICFTLRHSTRHSHWLAIHFEIAVYDGSAVVFVTLVFVTVIVTAGAKFFLTNRRVAKLACVCQCVLDVFSDSCLFVVLLHTDTLKYVRVYSSNTHTHNSTRND